MTWTIFLLFSLAAFEPLRSAHAHSLSSHGIKSYKVVRAIHDRTRTDSARYKRSSIQGSPQRVLTLELDHRNITLVLNNAKDLFAIGADIHLGSEAFRPIDSSILYEGYVLVGIEGEILALYTTRAAGRGASLNDSPPDTHFRSNCVSLPSDHPDTSYVTGGFYSNWFDGIVKFSDETWHVEPSRKYSTSLPDIGPSIIYNALDVDMSTYNRTEAVRYKRHIDEDSSSFCGLDDRKKQAQMREESVRLSHSHDSNSAFKSRYTRPKRQSTKGTEQTCCELYIRVDPTLWDVVYKNEGLNEKEATIHALVTFLHRTVSAANAVYRSVEFRSDGDSLYRFTLRIKRIRILTPDDCRQQNLSLSEANICRPYLDSNVFLTWHSAENFAEYCLSYVFSARDFGDGTLGLAWMGSIAPNNRGGICEKPAKDIFEGQRIIKTLNTGVITVINHHFRTSALMTELTFAHEVGHSLGAEHDDETCASGSKYGHYIMYRRATTGLEDNNNKFSNCSMEKMGPVVIAVKNQLFGKVNCLTECSQLGYCGNRNVEDGEECDCGFASECTDHCCYPAGGSDTNLSCKLKPGARCSPSRGPCCSDQCTFHSTVHICHKDRTSQDCIGDVQCDGTQATCPLNDTRFFKPVDTPCNQYTGLCDRGECNKSICTLIGKVECPLTILNVEEPLRQRGIDREYLCHIGCFDSKTNSCVDTHALQMVNNRSKTGFGYIHRPGHACAGTAGYCDVFGKCRAVDAEGPLTRLKNMLLNEVNIRTLTELGQDYWWALLLGCLGLLGLMSIFVKVCSVHTPSSNPRLKPARPLPHTRRSRNPRIPRVLKSPSSLISTELPSAPPRQVYMRGRSSSDNPTNTSPL